MRFGPEITWEIYQELLKTPNIRFVCKKVGIDHSTFYRWMSKHHSFFKLVTSALSMGRELMNDAAESVVISGIQQGDLKSAKYWLAHNNPRYSRLEQREYLSRVDKHHLEILKEVKPKKESEMTFEKLFDLYYNAEKNENFTPEFVKEEIDKNVKVYCDGDTQLEEIFYAAYAEWKKFKDDTLRNRDILWSEEE